MKKKSTEKRSRGQIRKRGGCCGWLSIGSEIRESEILGSDIRHYLVIPVEHVATVNDLKSGIDDHQLVSHMLNVGQNLLSRDAPESKLCRFGFHQPPFNSVDHLHLHYFALPYMPRWI